MADEVDLKVEVEVGIEVVRMDDKERVVVDFRRCNTEKEQPSEEEGEEEGPCFYQRWARLAEKCKMPWPAEVQAGRSEPKDEGMESLARIEVEGAR